MSDSPFELAMANRGAAMSARTPAEMIDLAVAADQSGQLDSVWVGDSLFVNS